MAGIQDIGNGVGYLYEVSNDGTKFFADRNTVDGARNMKRLAVSNAPIAANRSAVGIVQVLTCAAAGNLTAITINGVNQISANVPITTSTPATEAAAWAVAINAFMPGSGPDYTAQAIDDKVYIYSPPASGAAVNGFTITVSLSVGSTTVATTAFSNGASSQGVSDASLGRTYRINADYNGTATPTSLTNSQDITSDLTQRGEQTGIPAFNVVIAGDSLKTVDRYNNKILLRVDTQGGAGSDILAQINTQRFIDGDELILIAFDPTHVVNVQSAPATTGIAPTPNIYLAGDNAYALNSKSAALRLIFKYDSTLGPIFTETARASSSVLLAGKQNYLGYWDTDNSITDEPSAYYDPAKKMLALSLRDTQASPALIANLNAILNFILDATGTAEIISALVDGNDDSHQFKLRLYGYPVSGIDKAVYELLSESMIIWPGDAAALGVTAFLDGQVLTGTRGGVAPIYIIGTSLDYLWLAGYVAAGTDQGFRIFDLETINGLPGGQVQNTAPMSIYSIVSNGGGGTQFAWEWKLFSKPDSVGATNPVWTLRLRKIDTASPTVDLETQDVLMVNRLTKMVETPWKVKATNSAGVAQMVSGSVLVPTINVKTGARIFATYAAAPSAPGSLYSTTIVDDTSFTLRSTNAADTGPVNWWIVY